jgi:hypothetical protein
MRSTLAVYLVVGYFSRIAVERNHFTIGRSHRVQTQSQAGSTNDVSGPLALEDRHADSGARGERHPPLGSYHVLYQGTRHLAHIIKRVPAVNVFSADAAVQPDWKLGTRLDPDSRAGLDLNRDTR